MLVELSLIGLLVASGGFVAHRIVSVEKRLVRLEETAELAGLFSSNVEKRLAKVEESSELSGLIYSNVEEPISEEQDRKVNNEAQRRALKNVKANPEEPK
jgi:hypothetical protein